MCVSQSYPEKLNSLGPTTEGAPEVPLPEPEEEEPLPELLDDDEPVPELLEELVPEVPLLEEDVPLPELPEELEPLPDVPLLEVVPLPELPDDDELLLEPPPVDPEWAGVNGIVPPPQPARKRSATANTLNLSIDHPLESEMGTKEQIPYGQRKCRA